MKKITYTDHLGNKFETVKEMCKYWNVNTSVYIHRRNNGWSLKEILTTPIKY